MINGSLNQPVRAKISYLSRDELYKREKPYSAEFEIEENETMKNTNYILTELEILIHPISTSNQFTLDNNGFCTIKARTHLDIEAALAQVQSVKESYMTELQEILSKQFPEYRRIEPMECVVSVLRI